MKLRKENLLTDEQLVVIDREFKSLTDIIGARRIKKTPIPYSYNAFIKKFIFVYVISLPFGEITVSVMLQSLLLCSSFIYSQVLR